MKLNLVALLGAIVLPLCLAASVMADAQWVGGGGDDLWSNAANWDPNFVPVSATDRSDPPGPPENDANVARMSIDGTNTLIEAGIDAVAFAVQVGHPIGGAFGNQSASNTLTMTGGSLTQQGNFLFNVGRGTNDDPSGNHLVQFNMSGGLVNSAGITVPEAFGEGGTQGLNAEMHVSGNSIVNTDLLRLGAGRSNSVVTISDNAQVNLTDDNNGFAPGALWIEAFEDVVIGTSLLDIRDNGVLTVHGEWWTDGNGDGMRGQATAAEADYIRDNYVGNGWIVGDSGNSPIGVLYESGVITIKVIPEPTSAALLLMSSSLLMVRRRR